MSLNCRFCNIVNSEYLYGDIDKPFAESESYIAISSIGAFIEGWTLIVPKKHVLSMREIYHDEEYQQFFNIVYNKINKIYGKAIIFEHGSSYEGSLTACGTNHAHIHIVPIDSSVKREIQSFKSMEWKKRNISKLSMLNKNTEYLYYYEMNEQISWTEINGYLHIVTNPTSQFFRKILAMKIGGNIDFDYKKNPQLDITLRTFEKLNSGNYNA